MKQKSLKIKVQGKDIRIQTDRKVAGPSSLSMFFAQNITIKKGESVFDVGYGTGFLGILAAKLGAGKIVGSEINQKAPKLAKRNITQNKVQFEILKGNFFAGRKEKFDVIIGNVPQAIAPKGMSKEERKTIGLERSKGNQTFLRFLEEAKKHLKKKGRIYCAICYLQDYRETIKEIENNYHVKRIARRKCPLPQEYAVRFSGSAKQYRRLYQQKKIKLIDDLLELRLKETFIY